MMVQPWFNSSGTAMDFLMQADLWNMALSVFTSAIGGWFYVLMILFVDMLLMMRSQSIAVPALFTVTVVACLASLMPQEVWVIAAAVTILFFVVALLRFFTRGNP